MNIIQRLCVLGAVAATLAGCVHNNPAQSTPDSSQASAANDSGIYDPFEPWNRRVYAVNVRLDQYVLEPSANAYAAVLPPQARNSVRGVLDNLKTPMWLANDLLQGDLNHAGDTTARFMLNTTFGVFGLYDFAANVAGIPKRDEDFGQTLGVWGVSEGPYIMLPILGPSTLRDTTGLVVDIGFDPLTYADFEGVTATRLGLRAVDVVDLRDRTAPAIALANSSADPYEQIRALYIETRQRAINNGVVDYDSLPEFEEFDE